MTLTNEEDKPTPGGEAKGLWNACPEIPLPRWGKVLAGMRPRRSTPNNGTSALLSPFQLPRNASNFCQNAN